MLAEEEEEAQGVEGGGRLIRHGARAQSPPLDIMCLPAARIYARLCLRVSARALLRRPPKCIRSAAGFSLSLSLSHSVSYDTCSDLARWPQCRDRRV